MPPWSTFSVLQRLVKKRYKELKRVKSTLYFHFPILLLVVTQRDNKSSRRLNVTVFLVQNIVCVIRNRAYVRQNLRTLLSARFKPLR